MAHDDILEIAGVMGARPRPWHRLGPDDPAVRTAQQPQIALDDAPRPAEIQMAPALDTPIVDLKLRAGLPAARAHPAPAPQLDGHDHPLAAEADVADRCAGQPNSPFNAVVTRTSSLLVSRLPSDSQQPAGQDGGVSPRPTQDAQGQ